MIQDVQYSTYTPLNNRHKIALLLTEENTNPDVSISFDDVDGETITGINTVGTTSNVDQSDYVGGKNGKSLYLHDGGKVRLNGSEYGCFSNLDLCTSGVTMSIWLKPMHLRTSYIVSTGAIFEKGLGFVVETNGIHVVVTLDNGRYGAKSKSLLTVGIWAHVTCVYEATS